MRGPPARRPGALTAPRRQKGSTMTDDKAEAKRRTNDVAFQTWADAKFMLAVEAALHELPEIQAETLRRLYGIGEASGHSVAEVAAATGVSVSTVRRRRDAGLRAIVRLDGRGMAEKAKLT